MTELERLRARIAELERIPHRDFYENEQLGTCRERLRTLETQLALGLGAGRREAPPSETCEGFHHAEP